MNHSPLMSHSNACTRLNDHARGPMSSIIDGTDFYKKAKAAFTKLCIHTAVDGWGFLTGIA